MWVVSGEGEWCALGQVLVRVDHSLIQRDGGEWSGMLGWQAVGDPWCPAPDTILQDSPEFASVPGCWWQMVEIY